MRTLWHWAFHEVLEPCKSDEWIETVDGRFQVSEKFWDSETFWIHVQLARSCGAWSLKICCNLAMFGSRLFPRFIINKVIWYACCIYIYCRYIDLTCIVWIIDIWFVYDIMISICAKVNVFHAFPALDFWPCSARREEPELRPSASEVFESPRGAAVLACHPDGEAAVLTCFTRAVAGVVKDRGCWISLMHSCCGCFWLVLVWT